MKSLPMSQQSNGDTHHGSNSLSAIFISKTTQNGKCLRLQINALIKELAKNTKWNLSFKKYSQDTLDQIISEIKNCEHVESLWMHWNEYPRTVGLLKDHNFANLKVLNLGGNNIESLYHLQGARFESLEQLWLWFNRIVRFDCLRKCHMPNLKILDVSDNQILQCNKFYQLHSPKLERVNIEKNSFNSLTHFVKSILRSKQFKILFMDNQLVKAFNRPITRGRATINEFTYRREKYLLKRLMDLQHQIIEKGRKIRDRVIPIEPIEIIELYEFMNSLLHDLIELNGQWI